MGAKLLVTFSAEGEPVEKLDIDILARALGRIQREKLDINHFEANEFVKGECWVIMDSDLCTIAIGETFSETLTKLVKNEL